jgi:MoaA/NifB/PqqE/SkfB family radical SAM enzyme
MAGSKYVIELTNDCNLSCTMCPRNYINMEIGYMSKGLFLELIDKIPKGSTVLPFWRGESTLHPDFREMIEELDDYDVVLATNGTNPDQILEVLEYLNAVNVSIHNSQSYEGYRKIKNHVNGSKPSVIASRVEGELEFIKNDRVYKQHTIDGIWGKVDGVDGIQKTRCSKKDETVIAWDGKIGKCCYVWDFSVSESVCSTCSQWMGNGKAL